MKQPPIQNKYLQPLGAPVDNSIKQTNYVPWRFGIHQGMQFKKIRSSTGFFNKLSAEVLGSVTNITGGTINTSTFNTGTINNSIFSGSISQPQITGGTSVNLVENTGTFNTSLFQNGTVSGGTVNNAILGTPLLTGGTLNPLVYQTGGTIGTAGSIIYVKTVSPGTTFGTLNFNNGLITSFS